MRLKLTLFAIIAITLIVSSSPVNAEYEQFFRDGYDCNWFFEYNTVHTEYENFEIVSVDVVIKIMFNNGSDWTPWRAYGGMAYGNTYSEVFEQALKIQSNIRDYYIGNDTTLDEAGNYEIVNDQYTLESSNWYMIFLWINCSTIDSTFDTIFFVNKEGNFVIYNTSDIKDDDFAMVTEDLMTWLSSYGEGLIGFVAAGVGAIRTIIQRRKNKYEQENLSNPDAYYTNDNAFS